MSIKEAIAKIVAVEALSQNEARAAMSEIVAGSATPAQIGSFAVALRMKGETAAEIAGLAAVMRDHARQVTVDGEVTDVVGTGGDGARTFNISTVSAFVVAAAGGQVAKHGNRGITSGCGAADILEALDVAIDLEPENVAASVRETGFGFMFAPSYHPAMRHAAVPRQEIGVRTIFNILGPLTNPARASSLLLGVAVASLAPTVAEVVQMMGVSHALVVHGGDGLDELSISSPSHVYEVTPGSIRRYMLDPEELHLQLAPSHAVRGGTIAANMLLTEAALSGTAGPARDVILLNAGAAMYAAEMVDSIQEGIRLAEDTITTGQARQKLADIRHTSKELQRRQERAATPA